MPGLLWYAISPQGAQPLPAPAGANGFEHLYDGQPLGVYTVFRTFNHDRFLYLEDHLDRMEQSIALLNWPDHLDRPVLRGALQAACSAAPWPDSRVRIDLLAAPLLGQPEAGRLLLALMPLVPPSPEALAHGVRVDIAPELARQNPLAKTAAYYQARTAYLEQQTERAYEYLLLDAENRILEGSSSNFYAVVDGILYTAGSGILEGITRKIVLQLAAELGIPTRLEPLPLAGLPHASEAFITSSGRGLVPVTQVGAQVIGGGQPGPVFQRLLAAYQAFIQTQAHPAAPE